MTAKSPPVPAPSPEQIGLRIRALRKRQKRTLAWLSAQCGLDKGFLSRLERGEKSASVGTLHTVAGALGSSLSALLGEADPQTEIQIVRAADRHRMTTAPGRANTSMKPSPWAARTAACRSWWSRSARTARTPRPTTAATN